MKDLAQMNYSSIAANPYMPPYNQQPYIPSRNTSQQASMQTNVPFLKGRLVSSIEEARAQSIDFDGSIFYFPDIANQRIYTKQINPDGTSTLNMYELKEIPKMPNGNEYVTRQEFEQVIRQIAENLPKAEMPQQPTNAAAQEIPISNSHQI